MNQTLHSPSVAMSSTISRPWPTRILCKAGSATASVRIHSDEQFLDELTRIGNNHTGWILLIAPPGRPAANRLQERGIDPKRVLIVHSPKIKNWQQTLERSLCQGHCAAVFTWLPEQIELDHARLQRLGQQSGILACFFGAKRIAVNGKRMSYGEQDIYLNH
uniref:cell division inhibitor n=1 Tax=Aeromonas jandaei TaxID=650 RepID=UPI003B9F2734